MNVASVPAKTSTKTYKASKRSMANSAISISTTATARESIGREETLGRTAITQNYRVGIAGGNKDLKYNLGYSYFKDQGAMLYSGNDKHNISFGINHNASRPFASHCPCYLRPDKDLWHGYFREWRPLQQDAAHPSVPSYSRHGRIGRYAIDRHGPPASRMKAETLCRTHLSRQQKS